VTVAFLVVLVQIEVLLYFYSYLPDKNGPSAFFLGLSVFLREALLLACAVPAWSLALDFVDVDLVDLGANDVLSFNAVPEDDEGKWPVNRA